MNVLIADAEARTRSALRLLFEQMPEVEGIVEVSDALDLLPGIARSSPGLLLLDWRLAGKRTAKLVPLFHLLYPGIKIVAVSVVAEDRNPALASGADAFASKSAPPDELLATLGAVGLTLYSLACVDSSEGC
jgi:DNA-binding NarL/FixJ family response regulator